MNNVTIVAAVDNNMAIGKEGKLLCHIPYDMKHFADTTKGGVIIMGRKTFESIPNAPLAGRRNIVLTSRVKDNEDGVEYCGSIEKALGLCEGQEVYVIGGGSVYRQAINVADRMIITHIENSFENPDTFFPDINPSEWNCRVIDRHIKDDRNPYNIYIALYTRKYL